jgi:large subunit ribosomal protein L22
LTVAAASQKSADEVLVRATARYIRISPRKARLVADQIRGRHIDDVRSLLAFSPRSVATEISKVVESAAANDEGPTIKRFRPRAMGRATPINKRTCHISVALAPEEEV